MNTVAVTDRSPPTTGVHVMLIDPHLLLQQMYCCLVDFAIVTFDLDGKITGWNKGAEAAFAWSETEVQGEPAHRLFTPEDRAAGYPAVEMHVALAQGRAADFRWHVRKDGTQFWADGVMMPMRGPSGQPVGFLKILRDVTETKLAHERVERMASRDLLTGVANRAAFDDRLASMLAFAERGHQWLLLFAIDLDRFKEVNDQFGHGAGDTVLKEAARRLTHACRESDVIARLGGDEFALLQLNPPEVSAGAALAEKLLAALAAPFDVDGHAVTISGSIGIAVFPSDAASAQDLRLKADLALYQAKKAGRNCYHYFTDEMDNAVHARNQDKLALRHAVQESCYRLEYQPIVQAATGNTVTLEALIRFTDARLAAYPVDYVIDLAREIGLIPAIGTWIFRQVCLQMQRWRKDGIENFRVAVNTCARELVEPGYIGTLQKLLGEFDLPASRIEIELTEREAIELNGNNATLLGKLHDMGFFIVLDDFGTGFSSLSYLRGLPIDTIKLDRTFVQDIPCTTDANKVVGAVISLAHALDITVTAEGVETPEQVSFLRDSQCQYLQGFYFSHSLMPQAATDWLRRAAV
jgi:diguanylate cyclase (GGDEF)-like protein/PAS domain S-box-containing protein